MSRYHIVWSRGAEARLAKMWNDNPAIRSDLSEACRLIESALARNPEATGREQSEHSRVITRPPLTVLYRVFSSDLRVRVIWVKFWDDYGSNSMTQIVLTPEQATILANSAEPVAVCRPDGSIAGLISPKTRIVIPEKCPFTAEEIAEAERAAATTTRRYSTKEVLDYARAHERP